MITSLLTAILALYYVHRKPSAEFVLTEASIDSLHRALFQGKTTCEQVVTEYIVRINKYDSKLHSVLKLNPTALETAKQLDNLSLKQKVLSMTIHNIC